MSGSKEGYVHASSFPKYEAWLPGGACQDPGAGSFRIASKGSPLSRLVAFLGGSYLIKSLGSKGCKIDSNILAMDSAQEKAE
jgi:hypothetical protein